MHKRLITAVVVILALLFTFPTSAVAGENTRFRGQTAEASFFADDGCVATGASVYVVDGHSQNPPGSGDRYSYVSVWLWGYDYCNWQELFGGGGSTTLAPGEFQIDRKLSSASLITTVEVWDWMTDTLMTITVDLTWTGTGDLERGSYTSHHVSSGYKVHSRFRGTFRDATATGSVSDGTTNFAVGSMGWASLGSVQHGWIVIY
jgi:hypothetical protein